MNKTLILTGAVLGGIGGAYLPYLWGDTELFSIWSIVLSTIGGIVGIWLGYLLARQLG